MAAKWSLQMIFTARQLVPFFSRPVTLNFPRMNAPSMRPSSTPFRYTIAFQLMPSKQSHCSLPSHSSAGTSKVSRYQKFERKNDSEI